MATPRMIGNQIGSTVGELLALPPATIEIQPTAHCHRNCSFCSHITRNRHGDSLSQEKVRECVSAAESFGVERITFSGGGEPLTWEGLPGLLERAGVFAEVSLTTSGDQFLDRDRGLLSPLADACLPHIDALVINVPAVDEEGIRKQIAGGPSWAQLDRLLRLLVERSHLSNDPPFRVTCAVVVSQDNLEDLSNIDAALHGIGVHQVYFKEYKLFGKDALRTPRGRIDLRARSIATKEGPRSEDLDRFLASVAGPRPMGRVPCWANRAGFALIVDPNGDVFLCTPTVGDTEHVIGNVWESSLDRIWRSPRRYEAVEALSLRSESGNCPIECRYHAHNSRIDAERLTPRGAASQSSELPVSNAGLDDF